MIIKKPILIGLLLSSTLLVLCLIGSKTTPIVHSLVKTENFGDITVARPLWGTQGLALTFVDTGKFQPADLAQRLASTGVVAAVIDSAQFINGTTAKDRQCLDASQVAKAILALLEKLPRPSLNRLSITGIEAGALIPFITAQSDSEIKATNLSIGFSVDLPAELALCPPLLSQRQGQRNNLVDAPDIKGNWRSVWIDKPTGKTAVFIKEKVAHAVTNIAAYNTPLDTLLIEEVNSSIGQKKDLPPMPVIEVPAAKAGDTVTLFYSGDGGWRDLDKTVAEQMAALHYSVVGVDVLRYFWERKTAEQVASDLEATLRYYRDKWGVKSFVLAGFSFGADILPVIFNRLPAEYKDSVKLLVFLALGNHADFEVHVAGWLGQTTHEMPLAPELARIPKNKMLCIYGKEEKAATGTACSSLQNSEARVIELPGGHHFDRDYPKLTRLILNNYWQHGIN